MNNYSQALFIFMELINLSGVLAIFVKKNTYICVIIAIRLIVTTH